MTFNASLPFFVRGLAADWSLRAGLSGVAMVTMCGISISSCFVSRSTSSLQHDGNCHCGDSHNAAKFCCRPLAKACSSLAGRLGNHAGEALRILDDERVALPVDESELAQPAELAGDRLAVRADALREVGMLGVR